MREINGKAFMGKIVKLEEVLVREGFIKELLSAVFREILNYNEEMIIRGQPPRESIEIGNNQMIENIPEIAIAAIELQKGDRCMVNDEEIQDSNDIVKQSFQRTPWERKMLFVQRRRRRRKEYRKRKKIKNGIILEVEEIIDKYGSKVKRKKPRIR
jgi:hypothetical protein